MRPDGINKFVRHCVGGNDEASRRSFSIGLGSRPKGVNGYDPHLNSAEANTMPSLLKRRSDVRTIQDVPATSLVCGNDNYCDCKHKSDERNCLTKHQSFPHGFVQ